MALQCARSTACIAWIAEAVGSGLSHPLHHSSLAAVICHYASLVQRCETREVANAAAVIEHPSSQSLVKGSEIVLLQTSAFFRVFFFSLLQLEMSCSISCENLGLNCALMYLNKATDSSSHTSGQIMPLWLMSFNPLGICLVLREICLPQCFLLMCFLYRPAL